MNNFKQKCIIAGKVYVTIMTLECINSIITLCSSLIKLSTYNNIIYVKKLGKIVDILFLLEKHNVNVNVTIMLEKRI